MYSDSCIAAVIISYLKQKESKLIAQTCRLGGRVVSSQMDSGCILLMQIM